MVRIPQKLKDPHDTALVAAIAGGDYEAAVAALRAGANVRGSREAAVLALYWAMLHDDGSRFLDLLVDAGADPKTRWQDATFVMIAAEQGALPMVRRLVELGVDPHAVHPRELGTALDIAIGREHQDVAHHLASLGVPELLADMRRFVAVVCKSWRGRAAWCSGPEVIINPRPSGWKFQAIGAPDGYTLTLWELKLRERLLRRLDDTWVSINDDAPPRHGPTGSKVGPLASCFLEAAVPVFRRTDGAPCSDDRLRAVCRSIEKDVVALQLAPGEQLLVAGDGLALSARGLDAAQAIGRRTLLESMAATLADMRPPRSPLRREPIAVRVGRVASKHAAPKAHRWGGAGTAATQCPACGVTAIPILRLDLRDPLLAGLGLRRRTYPVHWCIDCCDWGPLFFDLATEEPTAIGATEPPLPTDHEESDLMERDVTLATAHRKVASRIGGEPGWIQQDETPDCPRCGDPMAFVLQLAGTRDIDFCDEGRLYSFACPHCSVSATLIQSH